MKIVSIIGARPQFVKASVVSQALLEYGHNEILVNTGQHYDDNMARIFFEEMGIPKPAYNLGVGSGTHAHQTAQSMIGIESVLLEHQPDYLLVYGDTNATIAGALAAAKLHIRIAHIEAGLRSYNREMPEEINRVVTDVLSDLRFVPTEVARANLAREGIHDGVHVVGDVMVDSLVKYTRVAEERSTVIKALGLDTVPYLLLTIHRPSNADHPKRLLEILTQVGKGGKRVIFPVHPRSRANVESLLDRVPGDIQLIDPVGYLDMMLLEKNAQLIVTDSGGVQKEAYLHRTPCLTVRKETEWVETVRDGWNILVGEDLGLIPGYIRTFPEPVTWTAHYGDGHASWKIVELL